MQSKDWASTCLQPHRSCVGPHGHQPPSTANCQQQEGIVGDVANFAELLTAVQSRLVRGR